VEKAALIEKLVPTRATISSSAPTGKLGNMPDTPAAQSGRARKALPTKPTAINATRTISARSTVL